MSDRPFVNVGARNDYGDGFGTLVSTAVLVRTPASGAGGLTWGYRASRVDLLMAGPSGLGVTRGIADFFVTLFSDDGSAAHNPAAQLSSPYLLSAQTAPLLTFRASWYQQDISSAGWPLLSADTYYWIVVTPGSPLTMPNGQYNGALWSGISASQTSPFDGSQVIPPSILNDPVVFTARELTSERFQGDYSFGAGTVAAVSFLAGSSYWPSAPNAIPRFTNFAVSPPNGQPLRYGVQLIGWQVPPSSSPAPGCEYCVVCLSVCENSCAHLPSLLAVTASPSPTPLASTSSSGAPQASQTPYPTTIATTRYWIDAYNLTTTIVSDRAAVSVGARNDYSDLSGNLVSTAVLFQSPANAQGGPEWAYRPSRVDILMLARAQQARGIADFFLTLFSDDGSAAHNPAAQLAQPLALVAQTTPLLTSRGIWYQQDVSTAGWPPLSAGTYYWIVVTPGSPLTMPNGLYNGALWSGVAATQTRPEGGTVLPFSIVGDSNLFTGRELVSERSSGDSSFGANTAQAVSFLKGSSYWPNYGAPRFTNFVVNPPVPGVPPVRYGLQVLGWQVTPTTPTLSRESHATACFPRMF